MAPKAVLFAAILLCASFSVMYAQQISPTRLEGRVGDSVMFTCTSTEVAEAVNNILEIYNPTLDDFERAEELSQVNRVDDPNNLSNTNYVYGPLTSADNGRILHCVSSGRATPNATIVVIFPPMITGEAVGPIDEGMNLIVPLTVTGNPVPTYVWTRDGRPVTTQNNITVSLTSIMFRPVNRGDSGVYKIVATNSVGNDSFNFTLDVQYPSQFQAEFVEPSNFNCVEQNAMFQCAADLMEAVTFLCSALGNPASTVTIEHTSSVQPEVMGTTISIASATSENAGTYTCTARNQGFAPVQRVFRLYVGGVPVPVGQVNVEIRGNMVVFNWTYNNSVNGVPATEYVITIVPMGTNLVTATEAIPISQMNYTISLEELLSLRNHTVSLVVRNMQGTSEEISNRFMTPGSGSVGNFVSLTVLALMLFITSVLLH